jgi:hypothetical protein
VSTFITLREGWLRTVLPAAVGGGGACDVCTVRKQRGLIADAVLRQQRGGSVRAARVMTLSPSDHFCCCLASRRTNLERS